jgi:hypothetical protein
VRFLGKIQIFKLDVEDFPTHQIFFFSKVLEGFKYAKKRDYQANFEKVPFSSHPNIQVHVGLDGLLKRA